jgi:hypothetical protein
MSPTLVSPRPLGWLGIVRLGLVQTGLGAIVVLTTSTLNRRGSARPSSICFIWSSVMASR